MIIIDARAGLCNRMRVISSAIKIQKEYNHKVIVLWRRYPKLNCYFSTVFKPIGNLKIIEYDSLNELNIKKIFPNIYIRIAIILFRFLPKIRYINENESKSIIENQSYHRILKDNKFLYIETTQNILNSEDFSMFIPVTRLNNLIKEFKNKLINAIGVHIRRTDNIWAIENSPISSFIKMIDMEISKDNNVMFYLSTDDLIIEKDIINKYPTRIIINHKSEVKRDTITGIEEAIIDLYNLSNCKKIYGSYRSSFSDVSAYINGIPKFIVTNNDF